MADRQGRQLRLILIYLVLAAPLVFYGAARSLQSNANSPIDWVPSTFPPRAAYDAFCAAFGPGDAVVASWEGCTLDEPKLDGLTRALRESPSFREGDDWLFEQVISGRELAGVLTGGPAPISPDESVQRLRGTLVGPDGRTTCVIITFTPAGLKQRERLLITLALIGDLVLLPALLLGPLGRLFLPSGEVEADAEPREAGIEAWPGAHAPQAIAGPHLGERQGSPGTGDGRLQEHLYRAHLAERERRFLREK